MRFLSIQFGAEVQTDLVSMDSIANIIYIFNKKYLIVKRLQQQLTNFKEFILFFFIYLFLFLFIFYKSKQYNV